MGVWADLPYELAIHVLEALSSRSSPQGDLIASSKARKDLLSCTCVSRQFHTIARPLLFRNVHLESAFPHRKQGIYQFFPAIHRFASAIILEPHLGKYVRRLFVDSLGDYYRDFDVYLSRWNQSIDEEEVQNMLSGYITGQPDLAIILDALPGLGLSNGLVMHGRSDGIFVVLLHLLPNLQVLDIESYSGIACIACSCFGGFGGRIPAALLSISELSLVPDEGPYENGGSDTDELAPFMTLPSIRTVTVHKLHNNRHRSPWLQVNPSVPGSPSEPSMSTHHPLSSSLLKLPTGYALMAKSCLITNLCLKSSVASYKTLNSILMLPMHLEKFEYEIALNNEPFRPSDFLPGLLSQAASLTELKITFKQYDPELQDDDEPFIGSLSAMSALEILRAPLSVVLPGAKELIDSDYGESDDDGLETWSNDGSPADLPSRYPASACTRNPLDDLLPPNLTVLELAIGYLSLARFIGHTGIPQNLHLTSQCVPSLRTLEVSGDFDDHGVIHRLLKEVPKLNPPLNLILFNISNESLPSS